MNVFIFFSKTLIFNLGNELVINNIYIKIVFIFLLVFFRNATVFKKQLDY